MSNDTKNNKSGAIKVQDQPFILEGQIPHQIIDFEYYKQLNNRNRNLSQLASTYKRNKNSSTSPNHSQIRQQPVLVAAQSLGSTRTQDSGGVLRVYQNPIYNMKKSENDSPYTVKKTGIVLKNTGQIKGGSTSRAKFEASTSREKLEVGNEDDPRRITLYRATESNGASFVNNGPKLQTINSVIKQSPRSDSENFPTIQTHMNSGKVGISLLDKIVKDGSSGVSNDNVSPLN